MKSTKKHINSRRVAAYFGISVNTLHGMMQNGELTEYGKAIKKPGNDKYTYIFYPDRLEALLDEEKFPL